MIEFANYTAQVETAHWGWTIAFFLWFVGLSGMGMFLNFWARHKAVVYTCTGAAVVGTLLVVSHLSRMLNLPRAALTSLFEGDLNFGSWMLLGICLLASQCIVTLLYSLVHAGIVFKSEGWKKLVAGSAWNGFCAFLGVACTIYSGFLLTQSVGITLWNTALIPLLWIMSGMASATGAIELLAYGNCIPKEQVHWCRRTGLWVEVCELFTIFAFLHVASSSVLEGARVGAAAILWGPQSLMFWIGVVIAGSLIPFLSNLFSKNWNVTAVGAVLGIMGALMLRAVVLFSGYYEPIL